MTKLLIKRGIYKGNAFPIEGFSYMSNPNASVYPDKLPGMGYACVRLALGLRKRYSLETNTVIEGVKEAKNNITPLPIPKAKKSVKSYQFPTPSKRDMYNFLLFNRNNEESCNGYPEFNDAIKHAKIGATELIEDYDEQCTMYVYMLVAKVSAKETKTYETIVDTNL